MHITDLPKINSLKVGRLYLKSAAVEDYITRCCRMVLRESQDRTLPMWRCGSATLVRFANANYVVMTRHQLGVRAGETPDKETLETVRIATGADRLTNILLQNCVFETGNHEEEYHDLLIFEAADDWKTKGVDSAYFYPVGGFCRQPRQISRLVGYPSLDGVIDEYHENFCPEAAGEINIKRSIMDCAFDPMFKTNASHYRRYRHHHANAVMDGYSGGAVFSIIGELGDLEVVLDGIVVRAGPNDIYVIDTDYLVTVLSEHKAK
ncbi:hypothetical protein CO665_30730 [Rhizobium anhuiense]|uniref:hypothetical protein n=1 Tax=Rhizobium anhuiense TaxID=1184720 RepID=UPI000BE9E48A|nr:hypothetical protein [Rhizobium anhuiense]PDS34412.1 hypothetical protein CO665_30730 [Rhizobium anhuiense]